MNEKITQFLQTQTCCSISCLDEEGNPYCFSCYFSFDAASGTLSFKSSPDSYHAILISKNPNLAGTVLPDKLNKLSTKGIQFRGIRLSADDKFSQEASIKYHKRHPLALAIKGEVYTVQLNQIKMTNSSMGFGKKIHWEREGFNLK